MALAAKTIEIGDLAEAIAALLRRYECVTEAGQPTYGEINIQFQDGACQGVDVRPRRRIRLSQDLRPGQKRAMIDTDDES